MTETSRTDTVDDELSNSSGSKPCSDVAICRPNQTAASQNQKQSFADHDQAQ